MASQKDQYDNLFGSSDEESDTEEVAAPTPAAPAPAPAASSSRPPSSPLEEESSSEEEEEDEAPNRKRIIKVPKKRAPAQKTGGGSDSDDEEHDHRKRKGGDGGGHLSRAYSDSDDDSSDDGDHRKKVQKKRRSAVEESDDESDSDDGDHRPKKRKKGKVSRSGGGGGSRKPSGSRAERSSGGGGGGGKELSLVDQALAKMKRPRAQKLPDLEIAEMTQRLVDMMENAAKDDRIMMSQGKPATQKLKKLKDVLNLLKNRHLQGALVDNGQLLGLIRQWLQPLPDKSLPMFAVRTPLIDYLVTARVEVHRLKESGIGRVIQQLKKHPDETVENKAKLGEIIDNWSRLITGKGTTLKASMSEEGQHSEARGGGGPSLDGYYVRTARGVEIPIRTGFNFKKVALTFKEEYDRGQGKEDEAMEVAEREPRDAESRASKVRKALKDMGRKGSGSKLRAINVSQTG